MYYSDLLLMKSFMVKREMPGNAYLCLHVYIDSSNTAG